MGLWPSPLYWPLSSYYERIFVTLYQFNRCSSPVDMNDLFTNRQLVQLPSVTMCYMCMYDQREWYNVLLGCVSTDVHGNWRFEGSKCILWAEYDRGQNQWSPHGSKQKLWTNLTFFFKKSFINESHWWVYLYFENSFTFNFDREHLHFSEALQNSQNLFIITVII